MIAIPICAVLLIASSLIGRLFAMRGGSSWHERVPVIGFDTIDTTSPEGRLYQKAMILIFSILPTLSLIYFWRSFLIANVMLNDGSKALIGSVWDWSKLTTLNDPARICSDFNESLPDPCVGSGTVLPGLEPTIFLLLTVGAIAAVAAHWYAVVWNWAGST